jgi:predicted nucleotide-binding protein
MDEREIFEQLLLEVQEMDCTKESAIRVKSKCDFQFRKYFGNESFYLNRLDGISFSQRGIRVNNQPTGYSPIRKGKMELEKLLKEIIEVLEMNKETIENKAIVENKDVFVVHGHDEAMKQNVARFLETLDIHPIILNEKANCGDTIIEKLERCSDVGFAVILLSPCDDGRKHGSKNWNPRARQNVIAEMGYFIGKIGRSHVCILKKDEVEEPSDFTGIVYTTYDDSNGWQVKLCQELVAAGYIIDANKIIK